MASFDENGKYIKTNWKAGDKITATKLNKIEESIEAVNDNDISRHVEADARLDALEAKDVAHDKELTNIKNTIADNKAAAELGDYDINSRMTFLEEELNEGIEEVHNVASTVDGKIAAAEANMNNIASTVDGKIAEAETNMQNQVDQGKADMEAMVAEVSEELESVNLQLVQNTKKVNGIIDVKNYGAKGDGITDDTEAIKLAITECSKYNTVTLQFQGGISFLVNETIEIPSNVNLNMEVPLTITHDGIGMVIAGNNKNHIINIKKQITSNWNDMNNIGIVLKNNNSCFIKTIKVDGFTIGIKCLGEGSGFAYNNLELGDIINNHIGLLLTSTNGGWCNENLYIGGRFSSYDTTNRGVNRYGIVIDSEEEYYSNNNVFIKPSFELQVPNGAIATPILINYGKCNSFYYIRNENNSNTTVVCNNNSTENVFETGYGECYLVDNSKFPNNTITSIRHKYMKDFTNCIFDSGRLIDKACLYDGQSTFNVSSCHWAIYTGSGVSKSSDKIGIGNDYLQLTALAGLGVFVDTQSVKKFLIKRDTLEGFAGRLSIRCYDENDNILDNSYNYVKGASNWIFYYEASLFGGVWRNGSDSGGSIYFQVSDEVKKICVILAGGTNNLKIKSFSIYSSEHTTAWIGYEPSYINLGTTYPKTLTWKKGTRIINDTPSIGNPKSWVCIESGTPGIWASEGSLENI